MDLDELKRRWDDHDRKLDASIRLNTRLLRGSVLDKAETALKRLSRWLFLELLLDLGAALWLGSFIADHAAQPRFIIPALGLELGAVALIIACVRQLAAIRTLDHGAPIVAIQQRLEALRVERLRAAKLTLLFGPLVWTPLLIVTLESLFRWDVYRTFGGAWVAANLLFGLLVIPLAIWFARRYGDRMGRSPRMQRLMRDLAGHNLSAAQDFLRSLARFEEEESRG